MSTPSVRRKVLVLLLLATVFAAPGAFGARLERPRPLEIAEPPAQTLAGRAWSFLASLWNKTGCHIDPNGLCASGPIPLPPSTDQVDTGCQIDPFGRCGS